DFHYSVVPTVIVFAAAIDGLVRMRESREAVPGRRSPLSRPPQTWLHVLGDAQLKHGAVAMLAIAAALTQAFPLQDLWHHETSSAPGTPATTISRCSPIPRTTSTCSDGRTERAPAST